MVKNVGNIEKLLGALHAWAPTPKDKASLKGGIHQGICKTGAHYLLCPPGSYVNGHGHSAVCTSQEFGATARKFISYCQSAKELFSKGYAERSYLHYYQGHFEILWEFPLPFFWLQAVVSTVPVLINLCNQTNRELCKDFLLIKAWLKVGGSD